jgi:hypothetical protein
VGTEVNEQGSTLIVVLLVLGFFAFTSVYFVQYARWMRNVKSVPAGLVHSDQALRFARHRVHRELDRRLSDTGVLASPLQLQWTLPPSITVETTIRSLNRKLNLNQLLDSSRGRELLDQLLDEFGYPPRSLTELQYWTASGDTKTSNPRYGGYDYQAPRRHIYHRDELSLVSGFMQVGVSPGFDRLFTVHGTGGFNPLHLTPDQWDLLTSFLRLDVPTLPDEAREDQKAFRSYLRRDSVWSAVQERFPFMTKRDDSFQVDYRISSMGVTRRYRSIYTYNHLNNELRLKSRRLLLRESSRDVTDALLSNPLEFFDG